MSNLKKLTMTKEKECMIMFPMTEKLKLSEEEQTAVKVLLQKEVDRLTQYEVLFEKLNPEFTKKKELYEQILKKLK